jgi:hypothetical protein
LALDIAKMPNVVDLDSFLGAAKLAGVGEEPLQNLHAPNAGRLRSVVEDRHPSHPCQGDTAPGCHKRRLALAVYSQLQSPIRPALGLDGRSEPVVDLRHANSQFASERVGQRLFHYPSQPANAP